jgi:hypothetical protein
VVDDVWEVIEDDGEKWLHCLSGKMEDEINDGWFDADDMLEKDVFQIIE